MPKTKKPSKNRKKESKRLARKGVIIHLSKELRAKYKIRSFGVRKGDEVKIVRGAFKGKVGKVEKVLPKKSKVYIEGIQIQKADGTNTKVPIHPSNLIITGVDLSDKLRKSKIEMKVKGEKK